MKCEQIAELLPDYLQGNLNREQTAAVEQHCRQCADCADDAGVVLAGDAARKGPAAGCVVFGWIVDGLVAALPSADVAVLCAEPALDGVACPQPAAIPMTRRAEAPMPTLVILGRAGRRLALVDAEEEPTRMPIPHSLPRLPRL